MPASTSTARSAATPASSRHITVAIADTPSLQRQKDDPGRIDPTSREAADHSFNFLAAVSIVDGAFGLAQFDNERWNAADVRDVMGRLEIVCDASLNAALAGRLPLRHPRQGHRRQGLRRGGARSARLLAPRARRRRRDREIPRHHGQSPAAGRARRALSRAVMALDRSPKRCRRDGRAGGRRTPHCAANARDVSTAAPEIARIRYLET